jgi:kanamycin kinase
MSIPLEAVAVPDAVALIAGTAALAPVWRNELGGVTFRTDDDRYIKWGPRHPELDVAAEAERLRWAGSHIRVPTVLDVGQDATQGWLVTAAIEGRSAVDPHWIARPEVAVPAIGRGLRALHDALPVAECPFDWSVAHRVADAAGRGILLPEKLRTPPPDDLLVVCHGDACCPNTLLDDAGDPVAHVDLGSLGVADRWADISVASMSTEWNYGPGWDEALIAAYGVAPDAARLAYYRALWNAT